MIKVIVKKSGTVKQGEGHVNLKASNEILEFEDSFAKRLIEFGYAEQVNENEESAVPVEVEEVVPLEVEEIKEEPKPKKKGRKSVMFSTN